jgi:hypothetical protein
MDSKAKKSDFFMKRDWTVYIILAILIGSFAWTCYGEGEKPMPDKHEVKKRVSGKDAGKEKIADLEAKLAAMKEELSVMRKELADVLKESEKRDSEYTRIKASIAASLAEGNKKSYDKNGAEVLEALVEVSQKGDALVTDSAKFCDFIDVLLDKKEISDVEKVRARFRMSKLRSTAEVFHARIQKPSKGKLFTSCRILTVDDKLQVVVVNVGSVYGMRNGVLLKGGDKGEVKLKVISVRPFISGAIVIKGDIEDLAPGMNLHTGK